MQHRSTPPKPKLTVAPDAVRDLFHTSRIGREIAEERSGFENAISMKHFDLIKVWRTAKWLAGLGLPKLTGHEWAVLQHLVLCGRSHDHRLTWTATRGGQHTINLSLTHELDIDYHDTSAAVTRLTKVGLVEPGYVANRPSLALTEHFHRMMFEARWRAELRDAEPKVVADILASGRGWKWLVVTVDEVFRCDPRLRYTVLADRRRAVGEARYRCWHD